jgi:Zn-dependent protease with chaperone function
MSMIRASAAVLCLALAACGTTYQVPTTGSPAAAVPSAGPVAGSRRDARDFRRVAARIEPVAENVCREEAPGAPASYCDYVILLEDDPRMPPNAFQTMTDAGRPAIVVGATLLDQMQSNDEIAFVLSHEAAHHVARHLSKQQQGQMLGALILGGLVAATGAGSANPAANQRAIEDAMNVGAFVGGRAWSQDFELEADWLGAFIAARAGFDPERGAAVFARPALASSGGPVILSTHPASPQRTALAARAAAEIRRQQAAGLVPRPAYAESRF